MKNIPRILKLETWDILAKKLLIVSNERKESRIYGPISYAYDSFVNEPGLFIVQCIPCNNSDPDRPPNKPYVCSYEAV